MRRLPRLALAGRLRRLALAGVLVVAGGVTIACGPAPVDEAAVIVTTLRVEGMVCESCEGAISGELAKLDGVISAKADHRASSVEIRHDPARAPIDALAAAIAKLGYTVVR